jgi:NAD(P)-dependent dehydrogenase (short-subunit alcohol dehydrogenase family)
MNDFSGKVAIITGAASGIGRSEAEQLARRGCRVVLADLNEVGAEAVAEAIRAAGGEALCARTDVGDSRSVEQMIAAAERRFGGVDFLFTNAANVPLINRRDACAVDLEDEVFDEIHRVVLRGVYLCAKFAGRAMIRRGGGAMVFTATTDAQVGCAGLDAYTAAKGGVIALTRSLAAGLARHRIRVNAISPSFVTTPHQTSFMDDPVSRRQIESLHLLPVPSPDEVAPMAVFLASDAARCITGSIHQVDSGYTAFKSGAVDVMKVMNPPPASHP